MTQEYTPQMANEDLIQVLRMVHVEKQPLDLDLLKFALEHGADPNLNLVRPDIEHTNVKVCQFPPYHHPISLLCGAEASNPDKESMLEACKLLIDHGADLNDSKWNSDSVRYRELPLLHTTSNEIRQLLLENGADPNLSSGMSPMHNELIAANRSGDYSALETLLSFGGDINLDEGRGYGSPFYNLIHTCSATQNTMDWLFDHGFDMNKQNFEGRTAMHFAAKLDETVAFGAMLERGAKHDVQDHNGVIPMDIAVIHDSLEILDMIDAHKRTISVKSAGSQKPVKVEQGRSI